MRWSAFLALWVLALPAAAGEPAHPVSDEAVCQLRLAFTAERSFFAEKDRVSPDFAEIGFTPLPCVDGTRAAPARGGTEVASCRFEFIAEGTGEGPAEPGGLQIVAIGRRLGAEGTRYAVSFATGQIIGPQGPMPAPDCGAWIAIADPLQHYHQVIAEYACTETYAPSHPCYGALQELISLAKQGVGVAVLEYAKNPVAHELDPAEPKDVVRTLCGSFATAPERSAAAAQLFREARLADVLLGSSPCRPPGIEAASPFLVGVIASVCPGPRCLPLFERLRTARLPELDQQLAPIADKLVGEVVRTDPRLRDRALFLIGVTQPECPRLLAQLLDGAPVIPDQLRGCASGPVAQAVISYGARQR